MFYPENIIDEVRIRNDIVEVVSTYVHLERRGRRYVGLCPFHGEKTPSFNVDPTKQFFYCFGCQKGGNVIHFTMSIENLEFPEALKQLAERAGVQLPESVDVNEQAKSQLRKEIAGLNREAARWFYSRLASNEPAQRYLQQRGLSEKTLRHFGLGYASDGRDDLTRHLVSLGAREEVLETAGLAFKTDRGNFVDSFRNRLMFPIFDIRGNIIGFGGRVMDQTQPKYKNSSDTPLFNKSRELYGLNYARSSSSKRLMLVEGYMDVISMHQAGFDFAVASLGTALTQMQAWVLKKYAEEVIICYDADNAGQNATVKALEILEQSGCKARVLELPDAKDPDEYVRKHGAEKMAHLLDEASGVLEYRVHRIQKLNPETGVEDRVKLLNGIAETLAGHENAIERELYTRKMAEEYKISLEALQTEISKLIRKRSKQDTSTKMTRVVDGVAAKPIKLEKYDELELMLVVLVCSANRLFEEMMLQYPPERFKGSVSKGIALKMVERIVHQHECSVSELLNDLQPDQVSVLLFITETKCNFVQEDKVLKDLVANLDKMHVEEEKNRLLDLIKHETDIEKRREYAALLGKTITRLSNM